jgi:hypothetical protein
VGANMWGAQAVSLQPVRHDTTPMTRGTISCHADKNKQVSTWTRWVYFTAKLRVFTAVSRKQTGPFGSMGFTSQTLAHLPRTVCCASRRITQLQYMGGIKLSRRIRYRAHLKRTSLNHRN